MIFVPSGFFPYRSNLNQLDLDVNYFFCFRQLFVDDLQGLDWQGPLRPLLAKDE
jgi:hypothetical protein